MTGKKGDIVNLRQARKQRARAEKKRAADSNAVAFGRTKAERAATDAERARAGRALDAHRRGPDAPETPPEED